MEMWIVILGLPHTHIPTHTHTHTNTHTQSHTQLVGPAVFYDFLILHLFVSAWAACWSSFEVLQANICIWTIFFDVV